MSIPVLETRSTSTNRAAGALRTIGGGIMILTGFLVGIAHLIALPFIIAADKSFVARAVGQREAMKTGKRIAYRESMGVPDPLMRL